MKWAISRGTAATSSRFAARPGRNPGPYGRKCQYIWDYVSSNTVYWTNSIEVLLGCWAAGQGGKVGGTVWSDDGVQMWTTYVDHCGKNWANDIVALQTAMAQCGLPFELVRYEGWSSHLTSGLNNVTLTPEEQEASRNYWRRCRRALAPRISGCMACCTA
ncbi:MAG: hypothetical protein N2595_09510 [bacterium]|nr:hypothetical protein [bacterium]